jgi:hypothetical protein
LSHPFNDQIECILLCVPRDQSHISLTNYKGSIITNIITSRLLTHSLYTNVAEVKYKTLVVAPITGTLTG